MLFLGSTSAFDRPVAVSRLRSIRHALPPGSALLLGADLVKPRETLVLACDDPLGVTAAFSKNLLVRINRELGADFDLSAFEHRAIWNDAEQRVEMHLVSLHAQECGWLVRWPNSIRGRRSHLDGKLLRTRGLDCRLGSRTGFTVTTQWIDPRRGFALRRSKRSRVRGPQFAVRSPQRHWLDRRRGPRATDCSGCQPSRQPSRLSLLIDARHAAHQHTACFQLLAILAMLARAIRGNVPPSANTLPRSLSEGRRRHDRRERAKS